MRLDRAKTIFELSRNDIKAKYSNSLLGIIWAFVMPLITILVFWYVFQLGFKNLPVGNAPYILWFSAAYIPWIFFTDVLTSGCNCLVEYSFLVKKIKFDVSIIPVIKLISALFVHIFFIVFIMIMCLVYGYDLSIFNIQALYYTFATGVLTLGLSWLLSAVTVFFKDMTSLVNVCVQIGFWVTPILWNEDTMVNESVKYALMLNPMHYIVNGYRNSFIFKKWFWETPQETIYFWVITLLILVIGRIVFKRLKPFFADEV